MRSELRTSLLAGVAALLLPAWLAAQTPRVSAPVPKEAALLAPAPSMPGATAATPTAVVAAPAPAGAFPRYELFFGYSNLRSFPGARPANRLVWGSGMSTSFAINLSRVFGIVFDFADYPISRFGPGAAPAGGIAPARGAWFSYMTGPRLSWRHDRFTPFLQGLFGENDATRVTLKNCSGPGCVALPRQSALAANLGGGLDITLTRHLALRLFQAEYAWTRFPNPTTNSRQNVNQNNVRLSTGIVFRFGGNQPAAAVASNFPPSTTCAVDPASVAANSGALIGVSSRASDPNGLPLSYAWTASSGTIEGAGSAVNWDSTGLTPGVYTLTSQVNNTQGGTAACSADVTVTAPSAQPITLSCSADPSNLSSGESSLLTAVANDSGQYPLTYSWRSAQNPTPSSTATMTFNSTGLAPGTYTENGHADDGHGRTADCSVNVQVTAAPPSAPALEATLALNSVYFPTDQPGATNSGADPYSGLVASQQAILQTLAVDFQQYLTLKPDAILILEGHSDDRASQAYNQALGLRRADLSRQFLVEHGVPADRLQSRSFGKHEELDAAQVRTQMEANPDLTAVQRQVFFAHLPSIILAQNRRVDIVLNIGDQPSVRQYPFNAKDALTLMSDKALNR